MIRKIKKPKRDRRVMAKEIDVAVGHRLKAQRLGAIMKQEDAAPKVGISVSQLSRYESGENSTEPAMLLRLAALYGCQPSDFLDGIAVK